MSRKENKYGIAKANILVHVLSNNRIPDDRTVLLGSVVKIDSILAGGNITIRCLDKTSLHFEETIYYSKQTDYVSVEERIWPMLIAMPSPLDRLSVATNIELCEKLCSVLQLNAKIEVLHNKIFHSAIIKYIGPVEAMGGGHYIGLELLSHTQVTKCDGSYADKQYFNALPGTGLFVSIDKIRPVTLFLATVARRHQPTSSYPSFEVLSASASGTTATQLDTEPTKEKSRNINSQQQHRHSIVRSSENEMDLIELIGSWPGVVDNKLTVSNEPIKSTRNKSLNPVSHLISGRKVVRTQSKNDVISSAATVSSAKATIDSASGTPSGPNDNTRTTYDTPADIDHSDLPAIDSDIQIESSQSNSELDATNCSLTVGTLVEVVTDISEPLRGVIRWLGSSGLAGVELEEDHEHLPLVLTDGMHNGHRYFSCPNGRALFVPLSQCQRDSRFSDVAMASEQHTPLTHSKMFGKLDSPIIPGSVPPLSMPTEEDVLAVCGKYRGIQGHHNSCYLDATLFAMFTYTAVFDSLLFRPRAVNDIPHYEEVQRVLREEIVNPLRQNLYVRADRVMKLRTLLEELSSVSGLTSEEKDPEEFLNSLLAQILKAEPFLKLNSGQEAFHYQLFVEKDEGLELPSVQQLFEQSFLSSDIKLKEVPSCLIIQMPRFGKSFKMYPRILPSQLLDVTDIIENSPRQCTVCGKLAEFECRECFGECGVGLESTGFCAPCLDKAHAHIKRSAHTPRPLSVPADFAIFGEHCPPPRLFMELFAVVCIETSHYVAFVKCGSGHEAPWCFFDSMADRKGEQHGYNIPEMVACPDVSNWLSDDGAVSRLLHEAHPNDKQLPEHARRLLCDAYICMYQSPDVMMYR